MALNGWKSGMAPFANRMMTLEIESDIKIYRVFSSSDDTKIVTLTESADLIRSLLAYSVRQRPISWP